MSLAEEILRWPVALEGCDFQSLSGYLTAKLNRRIAPAEVEEAINALAARELIERRGGKIYLREPDRPELELYPGLEGYLQSPSMQEKISVLGAQIVFQRTATSGPADGRLTRPDFTLAAIQSWKFDPQRTLEVFSFEVKNRAGTGLPAVYEAVAHGRLVHHPYLVCPRSQLSEQNNEAIRTACLREGVGLITFDIRVPGGCVFNVENVQFIVKAVRRTPDPFLVQQHLEKRLSEQNCAALAGYARGPAA